MSQESYIVSSFQTECEKGKLSPRFLCANVNLYKAYHEEDNGDNTEKWKKLYPWWHPWTTGWVNWDQLHAEDQVWIDLVLSAPESIVP